MKTVKRDLTEHILNLLPEGNQITIDQALKTWYQNIRPNGGLRLTSAGYQILQLLNIESWTIGFDNIKKHITQKELLSLDHKIKYPYYIDFKGKRLVLFSSKEAMLATLYGDLKKFLENYS